MFKRICAFCLLFVLSLTVIGIMPVSAASYSEVQLLADLGIIDISEPTGLIPKGYTRGDFAVALNKIDKSTPVGFETESDETAYAADIAGNKNYNYIAAVIAAGYMETDSEKNFKPNAPITEKDAVKALVRALGYDAVVKQEGGTDTNYITLGNKLGLLKGVNIADPEKLTALEMAEILANSMSIRFFSGGSVDFGDACFYDKWDLRKFNGRIYANSKFGLAVGKAPYKRVNIGGKLYYTELLIADELVGSDVEYYVTNGDFGEQVVSICRLKSNDNVTFEAGDITGISDKDDSIQIFYNEDDKISIEKRGYAIVNGKTLSPTKELFDAFKSGTVTFVDSDRDGSYDVVHMTLLVQSVLEGINADDEVAVIRFDDQRMELKALDHYEIYLNNKAVSLSQIKPGMVIGIACDTFTISSGAVTYDYSKAELITLYASDKLAEGMVEEISDENVLVDEIKRPLGAGYYRLVSGGYINKLEPADYVTLYLDMFGKVVYYEIDSAKSALNYGYLIAAGLSSSNAFGDELQVRIMDTKGAINTYATNKKFILDGVRVDANSTTYSVGSETVDLKRRQVVKFRAIDGILRELDTQTVRTENGIESKENSLSCDLSFDPYAEGGKKRKIIRNVIDFRYALKSDCIVFCDEAPLYETNPSDNNFSVIGVQNLGERYIAGYDADDNSLIGVLCVWMSYGVTGGSVSQKALKGDVHGMVVEKITKSVNKDGENGYHLYLAGGDAKATYFAREDGFKLYETRSDGDWGGQSDDFTVHSVDSTKLTETVKSGDVVRIELNLAGEITYIEKIFDFATWKDTYKEVPFTTGGQVYGFTKLEKVTDKYLIYSLGNPDDYQRYIAAKNPFLKTVAVYYVNRNKTKIVAPEALPTASNGSNVKLFMRYYHYGWIRDTIAYVFD